MLHIDNPEADELARLLAKRTGRGITEVVIHALREQLKREEGTSSPDLAEALMEIGRHCAALPDRDLRSAEEILGYDERGVWS
ncbi:MAG: type II toxin-antitoxin system VapB family antitoxin [Acidobacteriia bacterium]|nr:type II toxin-antitoxin system VapB family antitoxin [Terriglobia bacterium]